MSYKANISLT